MIFLNFENSKENPKDVLVIIDNMMNLEVLFRAHLQTKKKHYYDIAMKHAQTTLKNHFRRDFSTYHVVHYDEKTGKVIQKATHQGFSKGNLFLKYILNSI